MRKPILCILFLTVFCTLLSLACNGGGNGPAGPTSGPPAATATPTTTTTSTPTATLTPSCTGYTDITANIGGADVQGNDSTDFPAMDLEGTGPNGDVYTFNLSSAATLTFSLCPTDDFDRDTYLFLRSGHCWNKTGELSNDDACDLLSEIAGAVLSPGTYFLIVTENGGDGPGPYTLRITSGAVPVVVCTATPVSTPQAVPVGQHSSCSLAYSLGSLGTGDSVATGHLDDSVNIEDWHSFTPVNGGTVTVTVDCYDNGLGQADFEVFGYGQCPAGSSVGSSTSQGTTVKQFIFVALASTTYYLDIFDNFGSGNYRLTVQTP